MSSGESFWEELVKNYGPPVEAETLSHAEFEIALAEQRVLRFGRKGDGYGSGDVYVYLAKTVEDAALKLDDMCLWSGFVFPPPCRLTEQDAERLMRNNWESYGDVARSTEKALKKDQV